MKKQRSTWAALLFALALIAAACGGDDDDTGTADDTGTEEGADDATDEETDDGATDDDAEAGTDDGAEEGADDDGAEAASGDPIRIGSLTSLTGPFTSWGIPQSTGMQLAVDDINAAGGVDGRPLELIIVDDQSDPEEGVVQIQRLHEEGVVAVAGTISSGVGQATAAIAEEAGIPLFLSKAGSEAILTQDSRYTFRTCLPSAPMLAEPWADYAESEGFARVGAVIADYAWGQSFRAAAEEAFAGRDGVELQIEVAPVEEQDFTTYLRALDEFEPELILASGHPPGTGPIMVQAADLGLDADVAGPSSSLTAVLESAGDVAIDRYADFSCADYGSDDYAELAARYIESSGQPFMEDDAVAGYAVVTILAEAIAEVGDDPAAIADYVRSGSFDTPGMAYTLAWTEWGELAQAELLLVGVGPGPAPEGLNLAGDWYPEPLFQTEPLEPYSP